MNSGDEISFEIAVSGGTNDDIYLTLYSPTNSKLVDGVVYEQFSDSFTAVNSGTYTFRFDNTGSMISNKGIGFSYQVKINTYFVYVDPLPDWATYSGNVVYDATTAWKDANPNLNFYKAESPEDANLRIQWVKEFGVKHVGYAYGDKFIEVGLGDSHCDGQWQPYSSDHVNWIMKHEIGHVLGLEHSSDPTSIMYPTAPKAEYGNVSEQFNMGKNQVRFIPFCLSQEPSSIQYDVKTTDSESGFSVYVVPSKKDFDNLIQGKAFTYYSDKDCFGEGYLQYFGECKGVIDESGLVIIHDQDLSSSTASITVNYFETDYNGYSSPFDTKVYSQIHETATIDVIIFGDAYDFASSVYQNKDNSIRFEGGNGHVLHRYSEFATLGQLFNSFGMSLTKDCLVFRDGRNFCNDNDYSLKFLVNGKTYSSLSQYVINDGDRIQIIYESIPKSAPSTPIISESKQTESVKTFETTSTIECGKGTVEKNGRCVVDPDYPKPEPTQGGCLIATATYGSELAPQVQQLREIRDNSLLNTESGTSFMTAFNEFYYSFSPIIADYERENPIFKETVKIVITPMISSLSILNNVNMDSEESVLGYGIGLILLNIAMYIGIPASVIIGIKKKL